MAIHNIYKASIEIKLPDLRDIKKTFSDMEQAVKSSVNEIDKDLSSIGTSAKDAFAFSDMAQDELRKTERAVATSTGRMKAMFDEVNFRPKEFGIEPGQRGGLSGTPLRGAREISRQTSNVFQGLEVVDENSVTQGLERVAKRVGSTTESIISLINKVNPEVKQAWIEFTNGGIKEAQRLYDVLIGNSIFTELFEDTEDLFEDMPDTIGGVLKPLEKEFEDMKNNIEKSLNDLSGIKRLKFVEDTINRLQEIKGTIKFIQDTRFGAARGGIPSDVAGGVQPTGPPDKAKTPDLGQEVSQRVDALKNLKRVTDEVNRSIAEMNYNDSLSRSEEIAQGLSARNEALKSTKAAVDRISNSMKSTNEEMAKSRINEIFEESSTSSASLRGQIAQLESTLARLPDRTSPATKEVSREFREARSEVLRLAKQIEGIETGAIDAAGVDVDRLRQQYSQASAALEKTTQNVSGLLKTQQNEISSSFDKLGKDTQISLKGLGSAFDKNLGGSRILAVREAFFGVGEATNSFGKVLDFFTRKLDDVGTTENKFAKRSADLANQVSNVADSMQTQLRQFASFAQSQGVSSNVLNAIKSQAIGVEDAYEAIRTSAISTGRVTNQQLARARNELEKFQKNAQDLRKAGILPPETAQFLDKVEKQMSQADNATRSLAVRLEQTRKAQDQFNEGTEKSSFRLRRFTGVLGKLTFQLFDFRKSADDSEKSIEQITKATKGLQLTIGKVISIGGLGALLGGLGVGAGGLAILSQLDGVGNKFTGLAGQIESESIRINNAVNSAFDAQNIISGAFFNNFGDSIEDVGQATQFAIQRFKDLDGVNEQVLQSAVENAFKLRDAYKIDVADSIDAAMALSRDYGTDLGTSFDFLAKLSKEGVVGPDVIDSITEYSTQIKNAGGDLEALFNLLETGFQGGGVLGTDKALDLFKEFRVRISEGSDEVIDSLKQLDINTADLFARLGSGDITEVELFDFIIQELERVGDRGEQYNIGFKIFGTMFEDLGQDAVLAMSTFARSIDEIGGSASALDAIYETAGAQIEQQNRRIKFALLPVQEAFTELRARTLPLFANALSAVTPHIALLANRAAEVVDAVQAGDWDGARQLIQDNLIAIFDMATGLLEQFVASGANFGVNYVIEVANGIIEATTTYIVEALNFLGDTIRSFMAPGSPPEQGPLSTIDKWGKGLMNTFTASFKAADFRFVEDALSPIKDMFISELGGEGFEPFKNLRGDLVTLVEEINRTGEINTELFDKISSGIGQGNEELKQYLKLQLELKKAQQNLLDVQNEVEAAEKAGFVSEELRAKLKGAEQQVEAAQENVDWQKELLKFQELSKDEFEQMGAAAALGAAKGTAAVRDAVNKQLEFVQGGFAREKQLLEDKLAAGAISYDEYLKELIKLEEKFIDTSFEQGVLSGVDQHIADLDRLKKELESLGTGGVGKGGGLLDGLKKATDISGVGKNAPISPEDILEIMGVPPNLYQDAGATFSENMSGAIETSVISIANRASSAIGSALRSAITQVTSAIPPELAGPVGVIGKILLGAAVGGIVVKVAGIAVTVAKFGAILARFSAIGLAVWLVWTYWDDILAVLTPAIDTVVESWDRFVERMGGIDALGESTNKFFEELKTWALDVGTNLKDWIFGDLSGGEEGGGIDFASIFQTSADTSYIKTFVDEIFVALEEEFAVQARWDAVFAPINDSIDKAIKSFAETNLGKEFQLLSSIISENLAPALSLLGIGVGIVAVKFGSMIPILGPVLKLLGGFALPISVAVGIFRNFGSIITTVGDILAGLFRTMSGAHQIVEGFFLLFQEGRRTEGLRGIVKGFQNMQVGISTALLNLSVLAGEIVLGTVEGVTATLGGLLTFLGENFTEAGYPGFGEFLITVGGGFTKLSNIIQLAIQTLSTAASQATELIFSLTGQVQEIFGLLFTGEGNVLEKIQTAIGTINWGALLGGITTAFSTWKTEAVLIWDALGLEIIEKLLNLDTELIKFGSTLWEKIDWNLVLDSALTVFTFAPGGLGAVITGTLNDLIPVAEEVIPKFVSAVVDGITSIPQKIADKFTELKESGQGMGEQITEGFLNSLGPLGDFARSKLGEGFNDPIDESVDTAIESMEYLPLVLVGESIIPDMVDDIGAEYVRMDEETTVTLESLLKNATAIMTRLALMWRLKLQEMRDQLRMFRDEAKRMLDDVEDEFNDIKRAIDSIRTALEKLPEKIQAVIDKLAEMSTVDFTDMLTAFDDMEEAMENTADWAELIKTYLEAAVKAARELKNTLPGGGGDGGGGPLGVNPLLPEEEKKGKGGLIEDMVVPSSTRGIVATSQTSPVSLARLAQAGSTVNNNGGVVVQNEMHFPGVTDRETASDAADEFEKRMNDVILRSKLRARGA